MLTCPSSVLAIANLMSLIAYVVRVEKGRRLENAVSPTPENARDPEMQTQMPPSFG